jgi:hypothetical protein
MAEGMGSQVEPPIVAQKRRYKAVAAEQWKTVIGQVPRFGVPGLEDVAGLVETMIVVDPDDAALRGDRDGEFTRADAVFFHHFPACHIDSKEIGPFLAELAAPDQIAILHWIVGEPSAAHPAADHGATEVVERTHISGSFPATMKFLGIKSVCKSHERATASACRAS